VRHAGAEQVRGWDAADGGPTRAARAELERLGVRITLGGDGRSLLDAEPPPRCLVKSPGIPLQAPLIAEAIGRIAVIDELELGWRLDDRPLVAITGTNGKSTVAELVRELLAAAGMRPAIAGNTLSGSPLSALPRDAADVVVCETSSFQLEGCPALRPQAAVLTNLTDDHSWHHLTPERYAAAKRRLFLEDDGGVTPLAVIGVDQDFGAALADEVRARGGRVLRVGGADGDYRVLSCELGWSGTRVAAATPDGEVRLSVASHGAHMARNALDALALADGLGLQREVALAAIAATPPVPGRFERVDDGGPFAVVVDFAHNTDGMRQSLATARALCDRGGRVIAVASAPWTYTKGQLERMGREVGAGADAVIVTSDRWSADEPLQPAPAFVGGVRAAAGAEPLIEADRPAAIAAGVAAAGPGDVVMVLCRGAREVAFSPRGERIRLDDRECARSALAAL